MIDEKVETTTKLFSELIKAPLISYDLATIDTAVESLMKIKNIVCVRVTDRKERVISYVHSAHYPYKNNFHNGTHQLNINGRTFRESQQMILFDGEYLGKMSIIFEITKSLQVIEHNRDMTFLFMSIEILLSLLIAYIIGHRLTKSLTLLTSTAQDIALDEHTPMPKLQDKGDEISVLSNALHHMQQSIIQRSDKLLKERNFYTALLNQAHSIILVMNAKGEIVLSNKIAQKIIGYSQEELQGKKTKDILQAHNFQNAYIIDFENIVAEDFPKSTESDWYTKDAQHLSFTCNHSCLLDNKGDIEYIITVAMDVTEKKAVSQKIRALLNSPLDSIILICVDETILEINEIAANRLGGLSQELQGKKLYDYYPQENAQLRKAKLAQVIETKEAVLFEDIYNDKLFKTHLYPILDKEQNVLQVAIFSHDVTLQRKAQKELDKYILLVDNNILISHATLQGVMTSVSQAFCRVSGYTNQELIGQKDTILRDPKTPSTIYEDLWKTIKSGQVWRGEIKNRKKNGDIYWVDATVYPDYNEEGKIIGYNSIRLNITSKKLLEKLSLTDALTKLYNRRYFDDVFDKEINRARRDKNIFCLLSLDVDNFKLYNDTYGHQMGDDVLFSIASVLKQNMKRATDLAFRIGGEEFSAIYIVDKEEDVVKVAETIRQNIEMKKIIHKGNSTSAYVTASFGVIFINFKKAEKIIANKDSLYKKADELLYKAKASGKNMVIVDSLI